MSKEGLWTFGPCSASKPPPRNLRVVTWLERPKTYSDSHSSALYSKSTTIIPDPTQPYRPFLFLPHAQPYQSICCSQHLSLLWAFTCPVLPSHAPLPPPARMVTQPTPPAQLKHKSLPEVLVQSTGIHLCLHLYQKWARSLSQELTLYLSLKHWHLAWPTASHRGGTSSHFVAFTGLDPFFSSPLWPH